MDSIRIEGRKRVKIIEHLNEIKKFVRHLHTKAEQGVESKINHDDQYTTATNKLNELLFFFE